MNEQPPPRGIDVSLWNGAAQSRRRRVLELDRAKALQLLASTSLGRIVYTHNALPTIRPVNHIVVDGDIIVRTQRTTSLAAHTHRSSVPQVVVAYEADAIDPSTHLGWSVVATGYSHLITTPSELENYGALLRPWADHGMDCALRIHPEIVTGVQHILS